MQDAFLLTWSLRENLRLRRLLPWIGFSVALVVFAAVLRVYDPGQTAEDRYLLLVGLILYKFAALLAAIYATSVVAADVEQKTIVYLTTRNLPRMKLVLWRAVAAMIAVGVISLGFLAVVHFATYGPAINPYLKRDAIALVLGGAAYTGLFTLVSLLANRAMIYSLFYAFGWETAAPAMGGDIGWLSVATFITQVGGHPADGAGREGTILSALTSASTGLPISPAVAAVILILIAVVTTLIGMFWFANNEYLPREDAE